MATPPLPSARRAPPPLPARSAPPPLPARGGPPLLPSQRRGIQAFDPSSQAESDRNVTRARGKVTGIWVSVNSTNVNRVRFDPEYDLNGNTTGMGTITIEFLSLAMYEYAGRSLADYIDIIESSSKGRFAYYEIRGAGPSRPGMGIWPSVRLRGPQRKVTSAMRGARAPRTAAQRQRTYTVGGRRGAYGAGGLPVR